MNQIQTPALPVQSVDYEDNMQFKNNVRVLCSRFQTMLRQRRRKQPQQSKRPLVIVSRTGDEIPVSCIDNFSSSLLRSTLSTRHRHCLESQKTSK